jgi:hypothetical protein
MKDKIVIDGESHDVIARQSAVLPHPHPRYEGKLVPFKTVNEVLLDDDSKVFECVFPDVECDYVARNGKSVAAHQTAHNGKDFTPLYDEMTIRFLLRTAKVEIRDHGKRGYALRTAQALNDRGMLQLNGEIFTAETVSRLFTHWVDKIQVRVPTGAELARSRGRADRTKPDITTTSSAEDVQLRIARLTHRVVQLQETVNGELTKTVQELQEAWDRAGRVAAPEVDPAIMEKAQKWDEFQKLMNGKTK